MKWLFSALLCVYSINVEAQPAKPQKIDAAVLLVSSVRQINFRITWVQPQTVDSTIILVYLSNDSVSTVYRKATSPDTVRFTIPTDTTTYRFLMVNVRRGLVSLPANVNYFFNADEYYKPVELDLYPKTTDSVTVAAGGTVQFCALLKFNDGTTLLRQRERSIPKCVEYYNKLPATVKSAGGAKQRAADKLCVHWKAAMGTITPEVC